MSAEILDPTGGPDSETYLWERYAEAGNASSSLAARVYYGVKPLMPRPVQLALRRAYAKRQAARDFPRWPIEPLLVDRLHERLRAMIDEAGGAPAEFVWFWPEGKRFAATMTHDVEGPAGIANIPRVLEVERRHGVVSSWNFCGEWYDIPDGTFDLLREAGCEIGLHGITHDNRMWRDRASFEADLPKVHRYLRDWGAEGWRSPATHRNAAWMQELGAAYDSSFPDTDPFEPKSGGCCSIFPYFLGDIVELPITLTQDHTLWEILRQDRIEPWVEKTEWIAGNNGLVNLILHPDYVLAEDRLALYDAFLADLVARDGVWVALPRDVARWWRARAEQGLGAPGAGRGRARLDGERLIVEAVAA
jgi:peptidoglycan/xylan/chitin deacetylase (PgdA/CDA1 family)